MTEQRRSLGWNTTSITSQALSHLGSQTRRKAVDESILGQVPIKHSRHDSHQQATQRAGQSNSFIIDRRQAVVNEPLQPKHFLLKIGAMKCEILRCNPDGGTTVFTFWA